MSKFKKKNAIAFTVKTNYKKVDGLEEIFDKFDVEPANPEYLVTVQKDDEKEGRYIFELYCGFEHYGNKFWVVGIPYDVENKKDIKKHAMYLAQDYTDIDWADAIKCIQLDGFSIH